MLIFCIVESCILHEGIFVNVYAPITIHSVCQQLSNPKSKSICKISFFSSFATVLLFLQTYIFVNNSPLEVIVIFLTLARKRYYTACPYNLIKGAIKLKTLHVNGRGRYRDDNAVYYTIIVCIMISTIVYS